MRGHVGADCGRQWLDRAFLNGVGADPNATYAATVPQQTFMIYQLIFPVITPALITDAFAATHFAAAAGVLGWVPAEWVGAGRATVPGAISGEVALEGAAGD